MNASSWRRLNERAVARLARRRSERLSLVSFGDRGGWWESVYAIEPDYAIVRAGADELARHLRVAAPAAPGDGRAERISVAAGAQAGDRSRLLEIGEVAASELAGALEEGLATALSITVFDLAPAAPRGVQ